jgi:ubiquinone biosynthesis protein UbiJ
VVTRLAKRSHGHGDLQATTRYVKILDEEDPKAADVMSAILGEVA